MSEVDPLSNSGLYPALPLGDQRRKEGSPQPPPRKPAPESAEPNASVSTSATNVPRPPKSLIDEYA